MPLLISLLLIAAVTLTPMPGVGGSTGTFCLGCGTYGLPDLVLNVLLFVPLGVVLGRSGMRFLLAVGVGLALSGAIEAAQILIPGRAATIRDIFSNAAGCGLGALLVANIRQWLAPSRAAPFVLWSAVAGVLLASALTGVLLRFDPPAGPYYGQWVPDQGHLEKWRGRLQGAYVDSIEVRDGPLGDSERLRASLTDRARVRVVATAGAPTTRLGAIFALMNDVQEEAFLLGPNGDDLVVRVRRRAADWRMDAPEFRFRDALAGIAPGAPLEIAFEGTPTGGCATVNGVRDCVGRPAAGSTWMLARAYDGAPVLVRRGLDLLTLLFLAFPAALLLRSTPRAQAIAAAAVLLAAFPAVAWSAGLALPALWEWCGVALAFAGGWTLNARLRPTALSAPDAPPLRGTPTPR